MPSFSLERASKKLSLNHAIHQHVIITWWSVSRLLDSNATQSVFFKYFSRRVSLTCGAWYFRRPNNKRAVYPVARSQNRRTFSRDTATNCLNHKG
jgi:hypothetical protein